MSVSLIVVGAVLLALPYPLPKSPIGRRGPDAAAGQDPEPVERPELELSASPFEPSRARPYVQDRLPTTVMSFTGFDEDQTVPAMFLWLDEEERQLAERPPRREVTDDQT
jgi:hypothetical protein